MKNLSLLSIMALSMLLLTNCKKEAKTSSPDPVVAPTPIPTPTPATVKVAEVNTAIYGKLTATWCGPCGDWGWTMNNEIIDAVGTNAIPMGLYASASSNFQNPTVNQWFTDFGGQSYPNFTVNGANKTAFSSNGGIYTDQTKADVLAAVDAFKATPVAVSAGGLLNWDGQKLTIKSAIKFYQTQTGVFYVAAYMIEDKAKSTQNMQTGIVEHHHVCRGTMSTAIYGNRFSGSIDAGDQIDLADFTYDVPADWVKENMYVALVIWKKVGAKYTFVNAAKVAK